MVYDDAIESINDSNHPCHHFYRWQTNNRYTPYQLPEPFSGKESLLGIAFIGLNPSITTDQVIPCYNEELNFEDYDSYYRNRFEDDNRDFLNKIIIRRTDGSTLKPKFWNSIENFANNHLQILSNGIFKLGKHAILSQAIRYKSKNGWFGDTQEEKNRTMTHQEKFVEALVENEGINIFVPMGNEALKIMASITNQTSKVPSKITAAMGNSYYGEVKSGKKVALCPIKHLSYPPAKEKQKSVASQIIAAYRIFNE